MFHPPVPPSVDDVGARSPYRARRPRLSDDRERATGKRIVRKQCFGISLDGHRAGTHVRERPGRPAKRYEIRVQSILDEGWSAWFGGLEVRSEGENTTVITGAVADQAALHGVLTRINDLGLTLVSVCQRDASSRRER